MRERKRTMLLFFVMLTIVIVAAMATLRGQSQQGSVSIKQENDNQSQMPLVNYSDPEPVEPGKQAERNIKSLRYKSRPAQVKETPDVVEVTEAESWIERLPALPVAQSDAVVVGTITNAQAFLSGDTTGVYSEFNVKISEILKDNSGLSLAPDKTLIAEREGGRVRFPSGHVQSFKLSGQGAPQIGRRYIFFLKRTEQTQGFLLLTAYELLGGRVFPIGEVTRHDAYKGFDETSFLEVVRDAIANSSKALSGEGR